MKNFKKTFILIILTLLPFAFIDAQSYSKYMQEGKVFYNKSEYMTALERFDLAYDLAGSEAEKKEAKNWRNKSREKIKQQQTELMKALIVAETALVKAEHMQRKLETAIFDKAIKERYKEWKGYDYYNWENHNDLDTEKGLNILFTIDSLNLSENALMRLPKEVAYCKKLKSINIMQNPEMNYTAAFEILDNLPEITDIKLSIYSLDSIPEKYWYKITGIDLLQNNYQIFSKIPKNIIAQKQLTYLNISGLWGNENQLNNIPLEIFEMKDLQILSLVYCNIDTIPSEIGKLKNLKTLELSANQLSSLPIEIDKLTNLTDLYLAGNQLKSLPPEIGKLDHLTSLYLAGNQLKSLPPEIGKLDHLTSLSLWENNLINLPSEIGKLTSLTDLNLKYNHLISIPSEIGKLTNLTNLYLNENDSLDFKSVCYAFAQYPKKIIISSFENYNGDTYIEDFNSETDKLLIKISTIKTIPSEIGKLTNLTSLNLSNEQLSEIPPEIGKLTNLVSLELYSNQISKLPSEIGKLTNLTSLELHSNQISKLPSEIGKLTNLASLYLYSNQISELPSEIGKLTNLTNLYLGNNQINEFPSEIGNLTNLNVLDLSDNQLCAIPLELCQLTNLSSLYLNGNNFSEEEQQKIKNLLPNCTIEF